jgi:hypothetical protein
MFLPEPARSAATTAAYEDDLASGGYVFNNTRLWAYRPDVTEAFVDWQLAQRAPAAVRDAVSFGRPPAEAT